MKAVGQYDGTLQMFVEAPRDVDVARLAFVRWLVEHGRLEHKLAGPSSGEFVNITRLETSDELPLAS